MFNEDKRLVKVDFKDGLEITFEQDENANQYYIWISHKDFDMEECIGTFETYVDDDEMTTDDFKNIAITCHMKSKRRFLEEALEDETERQLEL